MNLFSRIFGCQHRNLTIPITPRRDRPTKLALTPAALVTGTYRVCTDCGKEFPYSLESMSLVHPRRAKSKKEATMRAEQHKAALKQ